jgi:hypothetical protein
MKFKLILFTALVSSALLCSSCALLVVGAAAGAGAGAVVWVRGELDSNEAVSYERAVRAVTPAMKDLSYAITLRQQDGLALKLIARDAQDRKIEIKIEKTSATVTTIKIRVGLWGDEALSRQILQKIQNRY